MLAYLEHQSSLRIFGSEEYHSVQLGTSNEVNPLEGQHRECLSIL